MSTSSAATLPMSRLDDDGWDDLLSFIEERRVEAAALVNRLSPQLRTVYDVRQWRERIRQAPQGAG